MRALSLKQPFAELILEGRKTIELRRWNTSFRGPFFIHASKTPDANAMKKFGFRELPQGMLVGRAVLKEVKKYNTESEHQADKNKHLADSFWGNYGFVLENVERIEKIPMKGKLNFWNVDPNP